MHTAAEMNELIRTSQNIEAFAEVAAPLFAIKQWTWGVAGDGAVVPTSEDIKNAAWGLTYAAEDVLEKNPFKSTTVTKTGRIVCVAMRVFSGPIEYSFSLSIS